MIKDSVLLGPDRSWHAEFQPLWRWGLQLHAHSRLSYSYSSHSDGTGTQEWRLRSESLPTLSSLEGRAILRRHAHGLEFSTQRHAWDPLFRSLLSCECRVWDSGRLRLQCTTRLMQGLSFRDSLPVLTFRHYIWAPP